MADLMRTFIATILMMCCPAVALACPFCNSTTAERVREGIFNADFGYYLAVSAAPFPILLGIVMGIYFAPSQRDAKRSGDVKAESAAKELATTKELT